MVCWRLKLHRCFQLVRSALPLALARMLELDNALHRLSFAGSFEGILQNCGCRRDASFKIGCKMGATLKCEKKKNPVSHWPTGLFLRRFRMGLNQRPAQSDYRDWRGKNVLPDRHSLPSFFRQERDRNWYQWYKRKCRNWRKRWRKRTIWYSGDYCKRNAIRPVYYDQWNGAKDWHKVQNSPATYLSASSNGDCCPQRWSKRWLLGGRKKQIVFWYYASNHYRYVRLQRYYTNNIATDKDVIEIKEDEIWRKMRYEHCSMI